MRPVGSYVSTMKKVLDARMHVNTKKFSQMETY